MSKLVAFDLGEQRTVLIEVDDSTPLAARVGDPSRGRGPTRKGAVVEEAKQKLDEALVQVRPAAELVIQKLADLAKPPEEISVEFGIKISAEACAVIAKAVSEANFQVRLTWKRPTAKPGQP